MFYNTHRTAREIAFPKEVHGKPSLTIPDQSLTIKEILQRYAQGLPLHASAQIPIYHGDNEIPDLQRMDLAEREQYLNDLKQTVEDTKARINQQLEDEKRQQEEAAKQQAKAELFDEQNNQAKTA